MSTSFAGLSLVAVHAHPDDETITMGGTLARYSAAGVRTVVVTCTRGDLGEVLDPSLVGEDVASLRTAELEAACRTLGVSRVVELGYGDSGMAGDPSNHRDGAFWEADLSSAAARLADVFVEERPSVVVTYDATGGYGHPDHVKAHQVTVAAFDMGMAAARLYFVRFPLGWSREFVRELRAAGIDAPGSAVTGADAGPHVSEIGVDDELVDTAVDVHEFVDTKRAALECYRSQWPPDHFLRRVPRELAHRLWAKEYFSLERGERPARSDDLFD